MNIWSNENVPDIIKSFRLHYLLTISAFPANTHTIERAIKKINHCSLTKRVKSTRSIYAIANSSIIQKSNIISRDLESKKKNKICEGTMRNKTKSQAMISYCINANKHHEK